MLVSIVQTPGRGGFFFASKKTITSLGSILDSVLGQDPIKWKKLDINMNGKPISTLKELQTNIVKDGDEIWITSPIKGS